MSEKSTITGRTIIGTPGLGVAAASVASLARNSEMAIQELQNPAEKDPKPPYKKTVSAMARTG